MLDPLQQELLDQARTELEEILRDIPPVINGKPVTPAEARLVDIFRGLPPEGRAEWMRLGIQLQNRFQ